MKHELSKLYNLSLSSAKYSCFGFVYAATFPSHGLCPLLSSITHDVYCNITKDSHNGFDFIDLSSITHVAFISMAAFKATALGEGPVATIMSRST